MLHILFVCLGNICRSAAAEGIMKDKLEKNGLSDSVYVDSAGILSVHQGDKADARMRAHAERRGYDLTSISRPVKFDDFEKFDLIIGMDDSNVDDLMDRAVTLEHQKKIHKMTEFSKKYDDKYVPDPYYGGASGFEMVLDLLEDSCDGLIDYCKAI
ncbi:MAG TPA: low molecular weight protein-tyrosine-phosphatase [Paludibacteraceae bacterium]|jgi:protein-tyrosine phosphatase|nr:low molecular weight protein-tyrosine-phosphatase [Paludibacteraceae bacterium]HOU67706.1 low molecular weight protein-tyrosine-phosphatase [Paludibacteraceae bacterium]HPH63236.1 low molecular weight protein-tyrosine-phosphatase [Paludibacteraceae bacterium]HQF49713.1 low molecular weight protein-tyrosine-phosphatase [Paludibacteraceae bacterium]